MIPVIFMAISIGPGESERFHCISERQMEKWGRCKPRSDVNIHSLKSQSEKRPASVGGGCVLVAFTDVSLYHSDQKFLHLFL